MTKPNPADIPEEVERYAPAAEPKEKPAMIQKMLFDAGFVGLSQDPSPDDIEIVLRELRAQSCNLDSLQRALLRNETAKRLQALGTKSATAIVNAAFADGAGKNGNQNEQQGQGISFEDPKPWPDPVDGAALLDSIASVISKLITLPKHGKDALALWTMNTWVIDAAEYAAILALLSPDKRCGKTRTTNVLETVVHRPLMASNITASALFRAVELYRPTLLIDEADSFLDGKGELRNLLNSGHCRTNPYVWRTVGEDFEPRRFCVFGPKVIAKIGELPDTLEDRSIVIPMQRNAPGQRVPRLRRNRLWSEMEQLRRQAARWAEDHINVLKEADPEVPTELNDRAADNWRSLFAIAEQAGGDWPERAREAAKALSGSGISDDAASIRSKLLADIKHVFEAQNAEAIRSKTLCEELAAMEERPWPEWHKEKPISPKQLASLLQPFKIKPEQIWDGEKTRGYKLERFSDAFSRYLPHIETVEPVGPNGINNLGAEIETVGDTIPTGSNLAVSDCKQTILPDLPDQMPLSAPQVDIGAELGQSEAGEKEEDDLFALLGQGVGTATQEADDDLKRKAWEEHDRTYFAGQKRKREAKAAAVVERGGGIQWAEMHCHPHRSMMKHWRRSGGPWQCAECHPLPEER